LKKIALIIGISGQDGSLLADLLLKKGGYKIYGTSRNASKNNFENLKKLNIFKKINICTLNCQNIVFIWIIY
jgi:GDPmannose 4,6-dehydratase